MTTPPNSIPWKTWLYDTASAMSVKPRALYRRITRGRHPMPPVIRVNQRVIFVVLNQTTQPTNA